LGSEKLLAIGPYPLLRLLEAREAKNEAKKLLLNGLNPVAYKKRQQARSLIERPKHL
jgi:hypothetical protein